MRDSGSVVDLSAFSSACEMLAAMQARAVSAVELLETHLSRIERVNPPLNAVVTSNVEAACERAREIDNRGAAGTGIAGLPMTIKDCIDTVGLPTTGGLPERARTVPSADAPPVSRLRRADAVFMGKTNVSTYASDWQADNPLFGRSCNPWDCSRTPGGSTGGGAAAVAAGLTPVELGGDFVGSIRIPAAFCGVYGHKPSLSAVPGTAHFPVSAVPNRAARMAVIGPLARTTDDLDLLLTVIAGPENDESPAWSIRLPADERRSLREFRVAVLRLPPWMPVDEDIVEALERTASSLRELGAPVEYVDHRDLGDLHRYFALYMSMMAIMSSGRNSEEERRHEAAQRRDTGDPFDEAWGAGLLAGAQEYVAMEAERESYRLVFAEFFRRFDVLLTPVDLIDAFPHRDDPYATRTITVAGQTVPYDYQGFFPGLANLSGHPATAFPVGFDRDGLPIGLQAVGPYLRDRSVIRFCGLVEREIGGFRPPPIPSS